MKVLEKAGEDSVYESAALPTELRRLDLDSKCACPTGKDRLYLYLLRAPCCLPTKQKRKSEPTIEPIRSKTKRPPGTGGLFSRENSSNGVKNRQNFLAKSYESEKGGVKKFLGKKYVCFQSLTKEVNRLRKCLILRRKSAGSALTGLD